MIVVSDISKAYGKSKILNKVTFTADPGDCIGILGANGCGKSTLLGILSGTIAPDHGTIRYEGEDALQNRKVFLAKTGYVPQTNPLIEDLSTYDNLKLWYSKSPYNMKEDLQSGSLSMLGIPAFLKKRVNQLSGGMQKRLSIGCALANRPPILLMDEPGAALDLLGKEYIRDYVRIFLKNRGTVILTTHEELDLLICTKLYLLQDGILVPLPVGTDVSTIMKRMQTASPNAWRKV